MISFFALYAGFFAFKKYYFLRDPERLIPDGRNIISPADGKVIEVLSLANENNISINKMYLGKINTLLSDVGKKVYLISIFMSPLDVHINRNPMSGKVIKINYYKGKFKPVMNLKNALENEHNEILLKTEIGLIKYIQVAGILARTIRCNLKEGDYVNKGERFGLIELGSQLIVIIPKKENIKLRVKRGDNVKAGESVLAEY